MDKQEAAVITTREEVHDDGQGEDGEDMSDQLYKSEHRLHILNEEGIRLSTFCFIFSRGCLYKYLIECKQATISIHDLNQLMKVKKDDNEIKKAEQFQTF